MRILILGAGATGGYFGGFLTKAGADVTFLVRPPRRDRLQSDGLVVETADGTVTTPVKTVTAENLTEFYDAVIVSAKAFDLASAIEAIRPAVGDQTVILPILNGMRHLDDLDKAFGRERVLGGTCHLSVVLEEDGRIRHLSGYASLTQGARTPAQKASSDRLDQELLRGGFEVRHPEDVIGAMWEKWILLSTLAGSTCLMRASIGEIVRTQSGAKTIADMLDECCAVAKASGHPPRAATMAIVRPTVTDPASTISASMLRDIQRGNRIEADHIIGDLIRRGGELRVPTPLLDIAYTHMQAYQNRLQATTQTRP